MSEILNFMGEHPVLAFFLMLIILHAFVEYPLSIVNRWIRHRNIVARGWPPEHLDGDGDWKKEDTKE